MKKIMIGAVLLMAVSTIMAKADEYEWYKFQAKAAQIENGNVVIKADRVGSATTDTYIYYVGAKNDDATTLNRIYATVLTGISAGNYIEAKLNTDPSKQMQWGNTYVPIGIRVMDESY